MTSLLPRFEATIERKGVVVQPDGDPTEVEGVLNPACGARAGRANSCSTRAASRGETSRGSG